MDKVLVVGIDAGLQQFIFLIGILILPALSFLIMNKLSIGRSASFVALIFQYERSHQPDVKLM